MSEVVRFLQKIAALDEGVATPPPAREGGAPCYSLLNLMDAAAQVPPLSDSSGVLVPTPANYPPRMTPLPGDPLHFQMLTLGNFSGRFPGV